MDINSIIITTSTTPPMRHLRNNPFSSSPSAVSYQLVSRLPLAIELDMSSGFATISAISQASSLLDTSDSAQRQNMNQRAPKTLTVYRQHDSRFMFKLPFRSVGIQFDYYYSSAYPLFFKQQYSKGCANNNQSATLVHLRYLHSGRVMEEAAALSPGTCGTPALPHNLHKRKETVHSI